MSKQTEKAVTSNLSKETVKQITSCVSQLRSAQTAITKAQNQQCLAIVGLAKYLRPSMAKAEDAAWKVFRMEFVSQLEKAGYASVSATVMASNIKKLVTSPTRAWSKAVEMAKDGQNLREILAEIPSSSNKGRKKASKAPTASEREDGEEAPRNRAVPVLNAKESAAFAISRFRKLGDNAPTCALRLLELVSAEYGMALPVLINATGAAFDLRNKAKAEAKKQKAVEAEAEEKAVEERQASLEASEAATVEMRKDAKERSKSLMKTLKAPRKAKAK